MTCNVEKREGAVHVRGEMTIYAATSLREDLFDVLDADSRCTVIDLADVSEIDTTGVQILMVAQRACTARGASFKLANPSDAVRETLELLKIASLPFAFTNRST